MAGSGSSGRLEKKLLAELGSLDFNVETVGIGTEEPVSAGPGIGTLGAGAGDADAGADEAAGADPTGGGGGVVVLGPGCSVVDFRRSCFLASCLLLWTTLSVVTVAERSATQ